MQQVVQAKQLTLIAINYKALDVVQICPSFVDNLKLI